MVVRLTSLSLCSQPIEAFRLRVTIGDDSELLLQLVVPPRSLILRDRVVGR